MLQSLRSHLPRALGGARKPSIPLLRLSGPIGMASPFKQGLSLQTVNDVLERAFGEKESEAVAIFLNSPGGSPVQSRLIHDRIRQLADEKEKTVYMFVEDVAASGGYLIALAGDEIIADPSSIVGSIGVISAGFGFDKAIEKLGIDRRVYTAGTKKMALDPFQPEQDDEVRRLKALQKDVHEDFVALVKARREDVLSGSDRMLFSGEFWTGRRALELGLVDRIDNPYRVMQERFGKDVVLKPVPMKKGGLRKLIGLQADTLQGQKGLISAEDMIGAAEIRALWARYGL